MAIVLESRFFAQSFSRFLMSHVHPFAGLFDALQRAFQVDDISYTAAFSALQQGRGVAS
jgi:hypothetical protein